LGVYLDEDRKWLLEAFVLAAPLKLSVYGDGQKITGGPNRLLKYRPIKSTPQWRDALSA
jgi:hypothetical protein